MTIAAISNGEAGGSVRTKLNALITANNALGDIEIFGDSAATQFVVGSGWNIADPDANTATILGGGRPSFPNLVGSTGKPAGADFTPTDWADDSAYVAGSAEVGLIAGGYDNVNNQAAGLIIGGGHNFIKYNVNAHSVILGGSYNLISAGRSVIAGGRRNTITGDFQYGVIGGGDDNNIVGSYSTIPGGFHNAVTGDFSFAAGRRTKVTAAGSTAFSDDTDADFTVSTTKLFAARFANGYRLTGGGVDVWAGATNTVGARQHLRLSSSAGSDYWGFGLDSNGDLVLDELDSTARQVLRVSASDMSWNFGSFLGLVEMTAPAAPAANGCYIYAVDNGAGKTQLMAVFSSGAAQQLAIQP